jgi:hypothetical protein
MAPFSLRETMVQRNIVKLERSGMTTVPRNMWSGRESGPLRVPTTPPSSPVRDVLPLRQIQGGTHCLGRAGAPARSFSLTLEGASHFSGRPWF